MSTPFGPEQPSNGPEGVGMQSPALDTPPVETVPHAGNLPQNQGGEVGPEGAVSIRESEVSIPDSVHVVDGEPQALMSTETIVPNPEKTGDKRGLGIKIGAGLAGLALAAGGAFLATSGDKDPKTSAQPVATASENPTPSEAAPQPTNPETSNDVAGLVIGANGEQLVINSKFTSLLVEAKSADEQLTEATVTQWVTNLEQIMTRDDNLNTVPDPVGGTMIDETLILDSAKPLFGAEAWQELRDKFTSQAPTSPEKREGFFGMLYATIGDPNMSLELKNIELNATPGKTIVALQLTDTLPSGATETATQQFTLVFNKATFKQSSGEEKLVWQATGMSYHSI